MKHKNILLVVFLLTLFVFQQAQAGRIISPVGKNPSQINPIPANASVLTQSVAVYIYELQSDNGNVQSPPHVCDWINFTGYGCGNAAPGWSDGTPAPGYPNGQPTSCGTGCYYLDVELDHLKDVLPNEMDFGEIPPVDPAEAEALKAQAVASRTFANYKFAHGPWDTGNGDGTVTYGTVPAAINNASNSYQVYIPGSSNLNYNNVNYLTEIESAVTATTGQYLSAGDGHTIDAEFGSDWLGNTIPTQPNPPAYLAGVQDPISTTCGATNNNGGYGGMSQRGAIRWALGNQCVSGGDASTSWSVQWNDYRQILAHYYTGIDILDGSGNPVAPPNRWNLLNYTTPNGTTVNAGGNFNANLTIQNTSTNDWTGGVIIGYRWNTQDQWQDVPNAPVLTFAKGAPSDPSTPPTNIYVPVPSTLSSGTYTLYLDLRNQNDSASWFSQQALSWPDAETNNVEVTNASGQQTVGIAIDQGSDDAGTNPTPCTFSATDNEVYLGECFNNAGNITSGFRFNHVPIPNGAHIDSAYITFYVDGTYTAPIYVQIYGEVGANSVTFSNTNPPESRPTTIDSVPWNITDTWNLGETRNTPDLSSVIQDIVAPGTNWNAGNSLSIIFKNNNSTSVRRVIAFERASFDPTLKPAQLVITYDLNGIPTATATPAPTNTPVPPTPVPTIVPTIAPTPVPQPTSSLCWCFIFWWFGNCGQTSAQQNFTVAFHTVNQAAADINLFYSVRDEILAKTPEGQRFIELYDTYSPELIQIAEANPNIKTEAGTMIDLWSPSLQALVDGKGDQAVITAEQISATEKFVEDISANASPEFKQAIADTLARHPLDPMVNMTMDQAWAYLNSAPILGTSSSIVSNFNGNAIAAGNYIWFNSVAKISGDNSKAAQLKVASGSIRFTAGGVNYYLPVPDTLITISPTATQAATTFNTQMNRWETTVPTSYTGNIFLGGLAFQVPAGGLPGGINPVTWSGQFTSDTAGVSLNWQWAAAVYTQFNADLNQVGVKPIDGDKLNSYTNSDHAGTPENYKSYVTGGARGGGGSNWTGGYSGTASVIPVVGPVAVLPGFAFVNP